MAWKVYRSRIAAYAKLNLEALYALNRDFADFVGKYMSVCCSIDLMQRGFARRGLLTSNPCEQLHSAWVRAREEPIMDFCTATLAKMAECSNRRRNAIQECVDRKQVLVPKAIELHLAAIQHGNTLKVLFDVETESILEAHVMSSLETHAPTWCVRIRVPGVNGHGQDNCLTCDCKFMVLIYLPSIIQATCYTCRCACPRVSL